MQCKSFYLYVCNEEGQAAGKLTRIADDSFSDCEYCPLKQYIVGTCKPGSCLKWAEPV